MKKILLIGLMAVSVLFATTAIAAETYTEKFVKSKTQKIVDKEKDLRAKQKESQKKIEAKKAADKAKVEKAKADAKAKKDAQKAKVDTKKKQLNDLLSF